MKVNTALLMTAEEGTAWHEFKSTCGPIYPGYPSFDRYMNWMKDRLAEYGCVDFMEHHWDHESYRVNDWPVWDTGAMALTVDGRIESSPAVYHDIMVVGTTGKGTSYIYGISLCGE